MGVLVAVAAVTLVLVLVLVLGPRVHGTPGLAARVRCVDAMSQHVRAAAKASEDTRPDTNVVTCQTGDVVDVTVSNTSDRNRSVVVVVADGAFTSQIGKPVPLPRGSVDVALTSGARLAGPGTRSVFVLFFADPAPVDTLAVDLDILRRGHTDVRPLERLPVRNEAQMRVDLVVPPSTP